MTGLYVASNVSSLISQTQLRKNMSDLGDILTRLSTGLRINSGKDDPAGLIASELLKSDMTATNKAITNTQRANSVISIADSSLGQVSSLLIDIKALIVEAANTGAMNSDQIRANQLQIDASLDSIDRISKTTNYQGQLLLDGSMDFQTMGLDRSAVKDLKIHQANFGTMDQVDINVNVTQDADYARLYYDKPGISSETVLQITGNQGTEIFRFGAGSSVTDIAKAINQVSDSTGVQATVGNDATYGQILLTSAGLDNDINLRSLIPGSAGGAYSIKFTAGNSDEIKYKITEPIGDQSGIIEFQLRMQEKVAPSVTGFDESFNGLYTYDLTGDPNGGGIIVETNNGSVIKHTEFVAMNASVPAGQPTVSATYNSANGKLQIHYADNATDDDLELAINSITGFRYIDGSITGVTGTHAPADLRAKNAIDISATVAGSKFENTDIVYYKGLEDDTVVPPVELEYKDTAQSAAATITWEDGGGDLDVKMRIVGKNVGADLNDVSIVFIQNDDYDPGKVAATYNEKEKVLYVEGQVDNDTIPQSNATYGAIKEAIEAASPFRVDVTDKDGNQYALSQQVKEGLVQGTGTDHSTEQNKADNAFIKTGQIYGDIGTDHQALFIRVDDSTTANDVAEAFNLPENKSIAANFTVKVSSDSSGDGTIFDATFDADVTTRVYTGVLKGGSDGLVSDVTARELVDFINNDDVLNKLFLADVALGQFGSGYLTLFDEAAYYGDITEETSLQFLGPNGSPDILFVTDGPNSDLGISFSPGFSTGSQSTAGLLAQNANAAFTVQALKSGEEYNNIAVRMIRLDNNHIVDPNEDPPRDDSYAQFKAGPSNAMAFCSILDENTGTSQERGKFIVYGKQGGEQLNNVAIIAQFDENQTEKVKVRYDDHNKQLIITVNSIEEDVDDGAVSLTEVITAINATEEFQAEYDFSFNNSADDSNGPGNATFGSLFTNAQKRVEIGNTGDTGGYNGVLEIYVAGDDDQITANRIIDAINNDPITGKLFSAKAIGVDDQAGTGLINFRDDNFRTSTDDCGNAVTEMNLVISGTSADDPGYMIVHLATDENGNSITTARDLVNFMNSLTAEQTKGISVSLVRPPGTDNLLRTWIVDNCGNVIENQECDDNFGRGILKPTWEIDDCDNISYYPIEFRSFGEEIVTGKASGKIVAVNGINASLEIFARNPGPDYNGVNFKYVELTDIQETPYMTYDVSKKEITVYIQPNTRAVDVKSIIETSEETKNLFYAELVGTGEGFVTVADNYLNLKNGLYNAGYRGGAHLLGASDADAYRLIIESMEEGSSQYITVRTVSGSLELKNDYGQTVDTAYGVDMEASINGIRMKAEGRNLSVDTSSLKLEMVLDKQVTAGDSILFSIVGGGATFQIGPQVVSNQQLRIGIGSVNTAHLGGASGRLYQLRSGNDADLFTNTKLADRIVEEAISSIAMLRGRLGAIQRSTLDPTINTLQDSLEALTSAEAQISNADFAEESSRLTRAQILVQAGTQTLSIANQFPQYAAMLIG